VPLKKKGRGSFNHRIGCIGEKISSEMAFEKGGGRGRRGGDDSIRDVKFESWVVGWQKREKKKGDS